MLHTWQTGTKYELYTVLVRNSYFIQIKQNHKAKPPENSFV